MMERMSITGGALLANGRMKTLVGRSECVLPPECGLEALARRIPLLMPPKRNLGGPLRHFDISRHVLAAVSVALADARLEAGHVAGTATGLVSASFYGTTEFLDGLREKVESAGARAIRPTEFSMATQSYPLAALAMSYGCTGPLAAFVNGAPSSAEALSFARSTFSSGMCRRFVIVGYDWFGPATERHFRALGGHAGTTGIVALIVEKGTVSGRSATIGDVFSGSASATRAWAEDGRDGTCLMADEASPGAGLLKAVFEALEARQVEVPKMLRILARDPLGGGAAVELEPVREVEIVA